jgi:imidazolonepropionase-like amidohydrolase
MDAIAHEARLHNLPVTTHATGTEGISRAAQAKFNSIEHCAWITPSKKAQFDPAVAGLIVANDIAVCPTMNSACTEEDYFCPWDRREAVLQNLRLGREMGVKFIVGTDAGVGFCPFERYADGLQVLGDAGYTNREIIAGATDVAAQVCGLAHVTGKLETGMDADLAAFKGNVLEDLKAFERPVFVMARGREHALSPIAPMKDAHEAKMAVLKVLREGAGMKDEFTKKNRLRICFVPSFFHIEPCFFMLLTMYRNA